MRYERCIQLIAVFLITLVISIPFYTTSVYATINKITVKGSDGIEGFAKATDFLNFNVQASIENDVMTNDQVVVGQNIQFEQCTSSIADGYECTLRLPSTGTESFEAISVPFTINLFKDDKTLDDSKLGNVTIDNKAPQVKLSTPQAKFSSQQNVIINYDVTDFACNDASCNNKCVGIKNIEFYTLDGAFRQVVEPATNDCNVKSSISIDPKTFNDGKNSVFAKATDKFDQASSETSVTFTADTTAPAILSDSFAIMRNGLSIITFSQNQVPVEVFVNISATDLNLSSVTADLSPLNPSQNLKNAKATCTSTGDLSVCKWSIDLKPGTGGAKTIVINASDTSGNKKGIAISKLLSIDNKGPVVQSLSTTTMQGTKSLAKPSGNTVIAVFDEATGLSADDAFLHIGESKIKATNCRKEANWICAWEGVNFGSSAQMSIQGDTTDVLGNAASEVASVGVTIDSQPPILRSINISPVGGLVQAFPSLFKIGDKIAAIANLTEENDVFANADFSKFVGGASSVAGSCERIQADEHICTWLSDSINLQASDIVTFNFSDNAGNTLIVTKSLKTYGLENATVPDFWANTVSCSPSTIDRSLGPLINQRVYCQVKLSQKSSTKQVSTVFIGPASCTGTSIVQNVETFNTEIGSRSPVIKITLKKDEFRIDNANLSCSLNIFSKIDNTVTKNPEIENAKIALLFSNLPLGEVSSEVQSKIEQAKKDAEGIWKIIGTLNKFMFYAKKICQLISTLYNVATVVYTVALYLGVSQATICSSGIGWAGPCQAAISFKNTGCLNSETASATADKGKLKLNKFCDYVTCKENFVGDLLGEDLNKWSKDLINQFPGSKYVPGGFSSYMDPKSNLFVAILFVCIPGIIYGLDKYRQIKCLYADCLQNAVGKEGLPVTACEDEKAYATCKYVTGELFALIPYTAVFDHFTGLIKNALSNPFGILGIATAIFCKQTCPLPDGSKSYSFCRAARLVSLVGDAAQNVKNIIDEGFTIRTDYCSRLESSDKSSKK